MDRAPALLKLSGSAARIERDRMGDRMAEEQGFLGDHCSGPIKAVSASRTAL